MNWDQAKQAVAKQNGFDNWFFLSRKCDDARLDNFSKQAAELMTNDAIKEDRAGVMFMVMEHVSNSVLDDINNFPLPFSVKS